MTQCPVVSSTPLSNAGRVHVGVGVERMQQLPKSASSSSLLSLEKRHDRRSSNPAAVAGQWQRRSSSTHPGSNSRRPSAPGTSLTTADGGLGHRPPKPHRGLYSCCYNSTITDPA